MLPRCCPWVDGRAVGQGSQRGASGRDESEAMVPERARAALALRALFGSSNAARLPAPYEPGRIWFLFRVQVGLAWVSQGKRSADATRDERRQLPGGVPPDGGRRGGCIIEAEAGRRTAPWLDADLLRRAPHDAWASLGNQTWTGLSWFAATAPSWKRTCRATALRRP